MKKKYIFAIITIFLLLFVGSYLLGPLIFDDRVNETLVQSDDFLLSGDFVGTPGHDVFGTAKIVNINNQKILQLENFESINGPDLYVYLSVDNSNQDFVNLGLLKGNIGNQSYIVDGSVNLDKYDNVLIWCEKFGILFGSSSLIK